MWERAAVVALGLVASIVAVGADPAMTTAALPGSAVEANSITLRGELRHVIVDRVDGEALRFVLEVDDSSWWLEGLAEDFAPPSGSVVEISGTAIGEHRVAVDSLRVVTGASAADPAAPASTRMLVMRVYWGASPPSTPTTKAARRVVSSSRAWFDEVSHRRYTVTGAVTPWLKVRRPTSCLYDSRGLIGAAKSAATRAGFDTSRYGRFIIYLPCSGDGVLGWAEIPGANVVLFQTLATNVVMHEQGHNLGLHHAQARVCSTPFVHPVTWSRDCEVESYGDPIDTMGNRRAGHFNAFFKQRLGWLQRLTTVSSTRTFTLRPAETTGDGYKAVRIPAANGAWYWLELRTRIGADATMPAGSGGVQIRFLGRGYLQTQVLDAAPLPTAARNLDDVHLPVGTNWVTPEGIRIAVVSESSTAARVSVTFGARRPTAPARPAPVQAQPTINGARLRWTRPTVNGGSIVRGYTITRRDNGVTRTVDTAGRVVEFYWPTELSPARSYRFDVRAVNAYGRSTATTSPSVRPLDDRPTVTIQRPLAGETVSDEVFVQFIARPSTVTNSPIAYLYLYVDGTNVDSGSWFDTMSWDTTGYPDGEHVIRIVVVDQLLNQASAARRVVVDNDP